MDNSYLRDKIAGDLFRESGVATPMRSFYRVYWDTGDGPVYFGLYTMAEVPDDPMFAAQLGETGGNLYKPTGDAATWKTGYTIGEASFPLKRDEDETSWQDVAAAIDALNADRTDAQKWREGLAKYLNVDVFLHWLAINSVIQDWDTYGQMAHNYYLYGDPSDNGRLVWIPWDHNHAMPGAQEGIVAVNTPLPLDMMSVSDDWPLIRYLLDDPEYHQVYTDYVNEFSDDIFATESMTERFRYEHALIAPFVIGEEGETPEHTMIFDTSAFETTVDDLITHVENRQSAVADFLDR